MPSKSPSVQTSAQSPTTTASSELISLAIDSVDAALLGLSCVEDLRSILCGILALSNENPAVHGLAKVGYQVAADYHNLLDCEAEERKKKLAILKGAGHA